MSSYATVIPQPVGSVDGPSPRHFLARLLLVLGGLATLSWVSAIGYGLFTVLSLAV